MKQYIAGLRLGMVLQLAVGPVCLMTFRTAKESGFVAALSFIIAVALVDALYITLATLGIHHFLEDGRARKVIRITGAAVLLFFGLNIILNVFGISLIPGIKINQTAGSLFAQGLLLTLSNPLTIVFWGSILTAHLVQSSMQRYQLVFFSCGLVSATMFFLSAVALLGMFAGSFLPQYITDALNVAVGLLIIMFGMKMFFKKDKAA